MSLYWKAREREYKAKQSDLSGVSYSGMPTSPTMKNCQEDIMTRKADDAWKYGLYQHRIVNALNDVIYVEDKMWYQVLHKQFIERKRPLKVRLEMNISHNYFYELQREALLHFYNCCKIDISIFYDDKYKSSTE